MTMLERCARAILDCEPTDFSSEMAVKKAEVRAVLAALREPDEAMMAATLTEEMRYLADTLPDEQAKRDWQAMIDAILEDDAETGYTAYP